MASGTSSGCFFSNFFSSEEERRSAQIDKQLWEDKKFRRKTHLVLLLGIPATGKSTLFTQFSRLTNDSWFSSPRSSYNRRYDIKQYLIDGIISILTAMPLLLPPVQFDSVENEIKAKWVFDNLEDPNLKNSPEIYRNLGALWLDKGVQIAYHRGNEYNLTDNLKHFFEKIDVIAEMEYLPTDEDRLKCPSESKFLRELHVKKRELTFRIVDLGGKSNNYQRHKLLKHIFSFIDDPASVIFVIDCSSFDVVLENNSLKLKESLHYLKKVCCNWSWKISYVVVVLNKYDVFKEKILSQCENFKCDLPDDEHPRVVEAIRSIKEEIENILEGIKQAHVTHGICALDSDDVERVFEDYFNTIGDVVEKNVK